MYNYWSKRSQMTADLKRILHENRAKFSSRLSPKNKLEVLRLNRAGDSIFAGVRLDAISTPMSPRARHALAWNKE